MDHQKLKAFFTEKDRFAKANGIIAEDIKTGYAKASMKIEDRHLNGADVVHGGAVFSLSDFAFGMASNSHGKLALSINSSISFINGAREGEILYAEAKEIEKNHKLGSYEVKVTNQDNKTIAIFQEMVYRKNEQLIKES